MSLQNKLDDAERIVVIKSACTPRYSASAFEDGMLELAKSEARLGESPAEALSRLCAESDRRMELLYNAARRAEVEEARQKAEKPPEPKPESFEKWEELYSQMESYARSRKEDGESLEAAFERLLERDSRMQELYKRHAQA